MRRRRIFQAALLGVPAAALGAAVATRPHADTPVLDPAEAASTETPAPNPFTPPLPPTLGVQFHGTWEMYWNGSVPNTMFGRHLDQLAAQGVGVIRLDVGWSSSQPSNTAPSALSTYNRRIAVTLDAAKARAMKVLVTFHQSPAWARPGTGSQVKQFPTDPTSIAPWATWMARTFGGRVMTWEVWNEPNLSGFTGISDRAERPRRYVPLLKAAYRAIKAGDPDAVVVFGGPSQNDDEFVRAAYRLGAKPYFDVMSVHPYQGDQTVSPDAPDTGSIGRMTHFATVARVMRDSQDAAKPVWWTEFGVSVHSNVGVPGNTPWQKGVGTDAQSALYLVRAFELARRSFPQVTLGVLYTAYRPEGGAYGHVFGYRMMDADGRLRAQLPTLRGYFLAHGGSRPLLATPAATTGNGTVRGATTPSATPSSSRSASPSASSSTSPSATTSARAPAGTSARPAAGTSTGSTPAAWRSTR